ncbi:MAG: hypothetical protein ACKVZH_16810 [Blastocatellia bacterium]
MKENNTGDLPLESHCLFSTGSRVIGLDSYDGITEGILQCSKCQKVFYFDLIDWDERDDADVRVFTLAPLPYDSFEVIIKAFSVSLPAPSWPVWFPSWKFSLKEDRVMVEDKINEVLSQRGEYEIIAAWQGNRLERLIAAKELSSNDLQDVSHSLELPRSALKKRDWFSFLSISRNV